MILRQLRFYYSELEISVLQIGIVSAFKSIEDFAKCLLKFYQQNLLT